jgi:hypothetical protein
MTHQHETNGRRLPLARASQSLQEWVRVHVDEVRKWPPITTDNDPGCLVEDCDRSSFGTGLCRAHYKRASRAFRSEGRP